MHQQILLNLILTDYSSKAVSYFSLTADFVQDNYSVIQGVQKSVYSRYIVSSSQLSKVGNMIISGLVARTCDMFTFDKALNANEVLSNEKNVTAIKCFSTV